MKKLLLVGAVIASGVAARAATDEVVTCRRSAIAVALTPELRPPIPSAVNYVPPRVNDMQEQRCRC
jgi:hypothetical protein